MVVAIPGRFRVTVEPVLFFFMLGIFLLFSVFQNLLYETVCLQRFNVSVCHNLYLEEHQHQLDFVQTQGSFWVKASTLCMVLPSIVMDCYLGSWSDLFGRKITLILPPIGGFLGNIVYIVLLRNPSFGVKWITLASLLQGMFGSFTSLLTGALAYVSSITSPEHRTARISIVMAMTFLAGTTGPFLSGFLATNISHLCVFVVIGCCHLMAVAYALIFIKDVREARSEPITIKRIFSLGHIKQSWQICFSNKTTAQLCNMISLYFMAFVVMTVTAGEMDIVFFFMKDKPLSISFLTFSYWFGTRYGLSSLMLLLVLPMLRHCGVTDKVICILGFGSKISALCILAFSTTTSMVFIESCVGCASNFALTCIRAMISQQVNETEQGKLFGFFAVFEDISLICGTVIFNTLYPLTRSIFNGLMFASAAVVLILPLGILILFIKTQK